MHGEVSTREFDEANLKWYQLTVSYEVGGVSWREGTLDVLSYSSSQAMAQALQVLPVNGFVVETECKGTMLDWQRYEQAKASEVEKEKQSDMGEGRSV